MHRYLGGNGANFLGEIFGARGSGGTAIPVRNERLAQGGFQFFSAINVNFFQHGHNSDAFGWTTAEAFYDLRRPTYCPKNNEYKR